MDEFEKVAMAITLYMKGQGWDITVISASRVQSRGPLEHNYELIFNITATKRKKP